MAFYEDFSKVYDQVMDKELYDQWLAFTLRHLNEKTQSIFELACGSGALSVRLAQEGYDVFGLDISEEMLTLASQKAQAAGAKIDFVAGDMRDLTGIGQFDAVTCYSDSICYMADLTEVKQVFEQVASVLTEGGKFIFDVHSTHQIDDVFPGTSYHENEEDFAFLWDSFEGQVPHSIEHELTFFVKAADGKFVRKDEIHQERTYEMEEYLSALRLDSLLQQPSQIRHSSAEGAKMTALFSSVEVYADFSDDAPKADSLRWFFVCTK
ncbi:class I SAM-dependent methyltransferase [Lactococcus sp.]|uniref:class I SAM-dependent DNA methyltransferase n=1 Tax=Lactococcus sp. TaxID=44273 RepID=UPI0035B0AF11